MYNNIGTSNAFNSSDKKENAFNSSSTSYSSLPPPTQSARGIIPITSRDNNRANN